MKAMVKLMIVAVMAGAVLQSNAADLIKWGNANNPLVDRFGVDIVESGNWIVALYEDGGNNSIDAYGGGDDVLRATISFGLAGGDGYFYGELTNPSGDGILVGDKIYTRLFDSTSIGSANWYANIETSFTTVANYNNDAPNTGWDYNPNNDVVAGSWQAVPEPATFMMFAMGGFGAWIIRRRNKD